MNQLCEILICLGVLVNLILLIVILVKQDKCCKNEGFEAKMIAPNCSPCPSPTTFSSQQISDCKKCFVNYGGQGSGTYFCSDDSSDYDITGCHNMYEGLGGSNNCTMGQPVAVSEDECDTPKKCASYDGVQCPSG